ncbi:hypothetical protein AOQ84DRAFT_377822 [Glonium stellatum]|uniref:Uncharacterized protein n=1 Tax=Glonium stellatum TaxID=574774 RepID=A0A8E2EYL9_9PEZI|nr:hypothetical protein AOQ84DRAFT_377822 [Glonium stellatum]
MPYFKIDSVPEASLKPYACLIVAVLHHVVETLLAQSASSVSNTAVFPLDALRLLAHAITVKDYVENLDPAKIRFVWELIGTYNRTHGDMKSKTRGKYYTTTMQTSAAVPEYRWRIMDR